MEERSEAQLELVKNIEAALEPVDAVFWSHDGPWQFVGSDYVGVVASLLIPEIHAPRSGRLGAVLR